VSVRPGYLSNFWISILIGQNARRWALCFVLSAFTLAPLTAFGSESVTLAWNTSTNPNVAGYNIYYGGTSGAYTNKICVGTATSVTISGLIQGVTYYFAATTYSTSGLESPFSSEISYAVPPSSAVNTNVVIGSSKLLPDSRFQLTVSGGVSGQSYVLLASTNLVDWTPISGFVGTNPPVTIYDPDAGNYRRRFYRIGPLSTVPPPRLELKSASPFTSNGLSMVLFSLPGLNCQIEASTDFTNWITITNCISTNSTFNFSDPQTKNFKQRFYRAVIP
jgi:hypothetical protein